MESFEFFEILQNTYAMEHLRMATSVFGPWLSDERVFSAISPEGYRAPFHILHITVQRDFNPQPVSS